MIYRGVRKELITMADQLAINWVKPDDINETKLMGVWIRAPRQIVLAVMDDIVNLAAKRAVERGGFDPVLTERPTTSTWSPNLRTDILMALNRRATALDPSKHIVDYTDKVTRDFFLNVELVGIIREHNGRPEEFWEPRIEGEINECISKKFQ
jgi:hypothetical protein